VPADAYHYGERTDGGSHGVVLTKPHVVELILDLAGYTLERNLTSLQLLEPSCGKGAFLVPAVERLLISAERQGVEFSELRNNIAAYDIDEQHVVATRASIVSILLAHGATIGLASALANSWIIQGDFLLALETPRFDVIVGNPPYVRIEQISPGLQAEYRRRYHSLYDRADLYVAFIERSLQLLSQTGVLSFICADRWTANKYGAPLRQILSASFRLDSYVDLHTASPFESEVIAYPSIFTIRRGVSSRVHVVKLATASETECAGVLPAIGTGMTVPGVVCELYDAWFQGDEPWVISSPRHLAVLRELESRFETLEADGETRVGIGVATGCDKVYIVDENVEVESDRRVPLVMREDIACGSIRDARRFVLNMFGADGKIVSLADYPALSRYVENYRPEISRRHVAQKNRASWFRTIDRVYPELVSRPKLLIPDIAGSNEVAYDEGRFHPHHNLYFVTSRTWDLEVLGGLLSSRVALFFVWSYAVRMRGGYLRFQAQYLRRIRVPQPTSLANELQTRIRNAFRARDFVVLDALALEAYALNDLPAFDFVDTRR